MLYFEIKNYETKLKLELNKLSIPYIKYFNQVICLQKYHQSLTSAKVFINVN